MMKKVKKVKKKKGSLAMHTEEPQIFMGAELYESEGSYGKMIGGKKKIVKRKRR